MSYIGNSPTNVAFQTDTFSGTGSQTAFTMSVAPANTTSVLVAITGVLQDPSTYSVSGTTLTFSAAPPSGTNNISARYLGIPASGVTTTAYRTVTNTTATAGQTSFSIPSYTVGYIDVFRNGVYLPTTDYTATTGTTVVLTNAATVGDTITTSSFYVSSVINAVAQTNGSSTGQALVNPSLTTPTLTNPTIAAGTTTTPSVLLTSGTNLTSATAGAIEYDGKVIYGTSVGTQRGIVPTQQYYRLNAGLLVASTASAVSIFGVGATLSASTVYEFEINFTIAKTDGSTAHTVGFGFGGTATLNNIEWQIINVFSTSAMPIGAGGSLDMGYATTASNTTVTGSSGASTTLNMVTQVKGTVSINVGGTFIPQYTCSSAPGGSGYTTVAGSYIRINPLSASGANTSVGTWA